MSTQPAGQTVETVLVHPKTGNIHKRRVGQHTMCGTRSTQLEEQTFDAAMAADDTDRCGVCFEEMERKYSTCPTITGTDNARFRQQPFGMLKGFKRSRPCELCFRTGDGEIRTPGDDEQVLVIDSRKRRCVHTVPNNWGDGE